MAAAQRANLPRAAGSDPDGMLTTIPLIRTSIPGLKNPLRYVKAIIIYPGNPQLTYYTLTNDYKNTFP
jgi:hypothetical protein